MRVPVCARKNPGESPCFGQKNAVEKHAAKNIFDPIHYGWCEKTAETARPIAIAHQWHMSYRHS